MLTRKKLSRTTGLAAGLAVAGLLATEAFATEELVVYGTNLASASSAPDLREEMKASVEALNQDLKDALDKDVKRLTRPRLQLALEDVVSRG